MKVAFFGRTSNGKSTAINSLLGGKILPTGIGHTTSCFLQVEGSHTGEAYLTTENNEEHQSLDSLPQLGSALAEARLESSCKVKIHWPVERCRLLGEEARIKLSNFFFQHVTSRLVFCDRNYRWSLSILLA